MTPRFLATCDIDGWKIKTYGVTAVAARPRPELVLEADLTTVG